MSKQETPHLAVGITDYGSRITLTVGALTVCMDDTTADLLVRLLTEVILSVREFRGEGS
jgi:hypothetical protein